MGQIRPGPRPGSQSLPTGGVGRPGTSAGRGYASGLDGIRALAVACVILYHLGVPAFRGGFVGVDIFFVVSGYLVTALLQQEHDTSGGIRVIAFYRRRARRLLPALGLMVGLVCAATLLLGDDLGVGLRSQLLGAVTFSSNWMQIASGSSYLAKAEPSVFTHLWSLAVEEQFYLLWPAVTFVLLTVVKSRQRRVVLVIGLAVVCAIAMAMGFSTGTDPSRVYLGTDTHGFGLLLGAALALARPSSEVDPVVRRRLTAPAGWAASVGPIGLIVVVLGALVLSDTSAVTFRGGLLVVDLGAMALVAATIRGAGPIKGLLCHPVLRWLGVRSYALYLWHWPALVISERMLTSHWGHPAAAALAIACALLATEMSWRLVEKPLRSHGFAGYCLRLRHSLTGSALLVGHARRSALWLAVAAAMLVVVLVVGSLVVAPRRSELAMSLEAGERALESATAAMPAAGLTADAVHQSSPSGIAQSTSTPTPTPTPTPTSAPILTPTPAPIAQPSASASAALAPRSTPAAIPGRSSSAARPAAVATAILGSQISAIGDSVMLASAPALVRRFPGADIDAVVSRQLWDLATLIAAQRTGAKTRPYLVIGLGTNGTDSRANILAAINSLPPAEVVVLVNAFVPQGWQDTANTNLAAAAAGRAHTCVADWHAAIADRQDLLGPDGVHPGPAGGRLYTSVIASALASCH